MTEDKYQEGYDDGYIAGENDANDTMCEYCDICDNCDRPDINLVEIKEQFNMICIHRGCELRFGTQNNCNCDLIGLKETLEI